MIFSLLTLQKFTHIIQSNLPEPLPAMVTFRLYKIIELHTILHVLNPLHGKGYFLINKIHWRNGYRVEFIIRRTLVRYLASMTTKPFYMSRHPHTHSGARGLPKGTMRPVPVLNLGPLDYDSNALSIFKKDEFQALKM